MWGQYGIPAGQWLNKITGQIVWNDGTTPTDPNFLNSGPKNVDVGVYQFTVIENDGHGSSATDSFHVGVFEVNPKFTSLPNSTQGWTFQEDASIASNTIPDSAIQTEQEGFQQDHHLTISGQIWDDSTASYVTITNEPFDATSTHFTDMHQVVDPATGHTLVEGKLNGPSGGELIFDTISGQTTWAATNADVTIDNNGNPEPRGAYMFTVEADNQHGGVTVGTPFPVNVTNAPTAMANVSDQAIWENSTLDYYPARSVRSGRTTRRVGPDTFSLSIQSLDHYPDGSVDTHVYSVSEFNALQTPHDQIGFDPRPEQSLGTRTIATWVTTSLRSSMTTATNPLLLPTLTCRSRTCLQSSSPCRQTRT